MLTEAQQKKIEESKLKELKAKNYLILQKDTAKDIWESLKNKCEGNARVRRAAINALRKDFDMLEMKLGETIAEYVAWVMTVANKMRLNGEKMEDGIIIEKILRSLTEKFLHVVCSIEESRDTDKMSIDELQSSLVVHEQKVVKFSKKHGDEQTLKVSTQKRGESWSRTRGRGNSNHGRCRGRGRQPLETVECCKCQKLGLYRSYCSEWEKGANFGEHDDSEPMLLLMMAKTPDIKKEEVWFLGSGCSNHMTRNREWFIE